MARADKSTLALGLEEALERAAAVKQPPVLPNPETRNFTHKFTPARFTYTSTASHPGAVKQADGSYMAEVTLYHCPRCGQVRPLKKGPFTEYNLAEAYEEAGICPSKIELPSDTSSTDDAEKRELRKRNDELHKANMASAGLLMAIYSRAPWATIMAKAEALGTLMDHDASFLKAMKEEVEVPKGLFD